jgi:hypothetical protein
MNRAESNLELALEESRRRAAPAAADRVRISELLRAQLGAAVVDGAAAPAPAAAPLRVRAGRRGWVAAVAGTGVVMGTLGFLLGYGLGFRERSASPASDARGAAVSSPIPPVVQSPPSPGASEPSLRETASPLASPGPAVAAPLVPAAAPSPAVARAERPRQPGRAVPGAAAGSFGQVVERLRRAHRALADGRASLALLQLEELEHFAGDTLREEREVTRILALCALGEVAGARQAAARLLASRENSIYAHRLEQSCARVGL